MSLRLRDLNMRAQTLANTREECLSLLDKGAKGGKTKWDEIEALRPASAGMLIPLALLHRRQSRGSVSPTTPGGQHTVVTHLQGQQESLNVPSFLEKKKV